MNQLASQALENQATIETLRKERSVVRRPARAAARRRPPKSASRSRASRTLKGELDAIRSHRRAADARNSSAFAKPRAKRKDDSAAATEAVKEIEKKLGPLVQLQELSKNTEERLASLNALAEHVSQKAKALEAQKHAVERAVVEANRLNEMVWSMDVQIAKLNEGSKNVARAEDTVARMEKLAQETTAQLSSATTAREEFGREFARLDKESRGAGGLPEDHRRAARASTRRSSTQFDQRLRALSGAVAEAEARMDGVLAEGQAAVGDEPAAPTSSARTFQTLMAQADEMARKQGALEALGERLAQVDEMGRRTQAQHEALASSRARTSSSCASEIRGLPQGARRGGAAARQAVGRSRRARSVRRARHDAAQPHAGARVEDGRGAQQDGHGRGRHQGGDAARRAGRRARRAADARRRAPAVHREARRPHQQPARRHRRTSIAS